MQVARFTDTELLESVRQGNRIAFKQLFDEYWQFLYQLASRKSGSDADAEDLVQELFIELWRKKSPVVLTTSLKTYLVSCLYLKIFEHFRKKGFREKHYAAFADFATQTINSMQEAGISSLEFEAEYGKLQEVVTQVVARMPAQMNTVFSLKHYEGQSIAAIAAQLNISAETVKSHLKAAVSRLRNAGDHYPSGILLLPALLSMLDS